MYEDLIRKYNDEGMSPVEISARIGYQERSVRKVLCRLGIEIKERRKAGRRSTEKLPKLSPLHEQIGRTLSTYRHFQAKLTPTEAAPKMMLSVPRLHQAEAGKHNFTLTELQHLCKVMGVDIVELVKLKPSATYHAK